MNDKPSDGAGAEEQEAPFATPVNRRDFVFNAAKLTAAAAAAGPFFMAAKQAAAAELASTSAAAGDPIAVSAVIARPRSSAARRSARSTRPVCRRSTRRTSRGRSSRS